MSKPSTAGWDVSMAKAIVERIGNRDKEHFGYVEIKRMLSPALVNAYKAGWDDCAEHVRVALEER